MNKIIILGVVSLFLFTPFNINTNIGEQSTSNKITIAYSFESPVISKVNINNTIYDSISMDGASCDGNPGEPSLPAKGAYILIPQSEKIQGITVTPGKRISLGLNYLIEPVEQPVLLSEDISSAQPPTPDETIYSSKEPFPGMLYTEVGTYMCKGYEILVLKLNPVQYIPATGELYYYPSLSVSVDTAKDSSLNLMYRGLESDKNEVMSNVDNPNTTLTYTQNELCIPKDNSYDLLIITSNLLKDSFLPLKQAHDAQGIKTIIYTVEDIYNNYTGVDNPEKIRNFIKYAYQNWGIQYVLLGGDSDIVPVRYLFGGSIGGNTPSDLYYSGLDGSWNSLENPNPSNMDISVGDPDINITSENNLTGPTIDYTNYIVGGSSLRFNCTNGAQSGMGIINLSFDNPIDLSTDNYLRFYANYSQPNLLQTYYPIIIAMKDNKGFVSISLSEIYSNSTGSWQNEILDIKAPASKLFNYHKVVQVDIGFSFNSSLTITENDFIRLDGIYFSDSINSLWGERGDNCDLYADVYVGRACADSPSDVQNFTSKTISYMNTNKNDPYLKKVTLVGEYLGGIGRSKGGGNFMDELIGKCHTHGYTTQGFPRLRFRIDKLYDRSWLLHGWPKPYKGGGGWSKEEIIKRINKGTHIINSDGHGNNYQDMKLNCSDVYSMTNDKYFFIYSQACYAGAFDNIDDHGVSQPYDCIAEYMTVKTEHGAFAGIFNSRYGIFLRLFGDGPSQRYNREFWDAVFKEKITVISKANQDSKEDNIWRINDTLDTMRSVYYELNYFGDPAIQFKYLVHKSLLQNFLEKHPHLFPLLQKLLQLLKQT